MYAVKTSRAFPRNKTRGQCSDRRAAQNQLFNSPAQDRGQRFDQRTAKD